MGNCRVFFSTLAERVVEGISAGLVAGAAAAGCAPAAGLQGGG